MKKILFLILISIIACTMVFAGGNQEKGAGDSGEAESYKYVVICHASAVPFFVPVKNGALEAGKMMGVNVVYTGPAGFDIKAQIEFIKAAIAEGVDGIATTMPNPDAFNDVVKEAMDKGIPVIALNADAPASGRLAYIGQGNYEAGQSMGREIVKLLPSGGHVMLAIHTPGAFNLEERISGVKSVLDKKGGFTYDVVGTTTDMVKATTLIGSYYQGHPNTKGFFGVEDVTGSAIAQVIDQEKLGGKVYGGAFDLVPDVMAAIKNGNMQFTIDQQPYLQGFQSVVQLHLLNKYKLNPTDVNTGIAPVKADTIEAVMEFAEKGYR